MYFKTRHAFPRQNKNVQKCLLFPVGQHLFFWFITFLKKKIWVNDNHGQLILFSFHLRVAEGWTSNKKSYQKLMDNLVTWNLKSHIFFIIFRVPYVLQNWGWTWSMPRDVTFKMGYAQPSKMFIGRKIMHKSWQYQISRYYHYSKFHS